jgi:hypothetical protein
VDDAGAPLPPSVRDLAKRLGANPRLRRPQARLRQVGRIRQDLDADWTDFRAEQTISTLECAFDWRARTGPLELISVRDALAAGAGLLDVRVLGLIPLARFPASAELTRGELMRYLAEIAWAPDAILLNPALRWCELDGGRGFRLAAGDGEAAAEVELGLDDNGRIGTVFAADRPRAVKGDMVATPWRCRCANYRLADGVWTPLNGEVAWEIDGREVPYWEGHVIEWTMRPD